MGGQQCPILRNCPILSILGRGPRGTRPTELGGEIRPSGFGGETPPPGAAEARGAGRWSCTPHSRVWSGPFLQKGLCGRTSNWAPGKLPEDQVGSWVPLGAPLGGPAQAASCLWLWASFQLSSRQSPLPTADGLSRGCSPAGEDPASCPRLLPGLPITTSSLSGQSCPGPSLGGRCKEQGPFPGRDLLFAVEDWGVVGAGWPLPGPQLSARRLGE